MIRSNFSHIFRFIFQYPLSGLSFVILTFLIIALSVLLPRVKESITSEMVEHAYAGHFHALVSSRHNYKALARELRKFPGIAKIEEMNESVIQEQAEQIISHLSGSEGLLKGISLHFAGLRVVFSQEINTESVQLIQEYMQRYIGAQNIKFGPIVRNERIGDIDSQGMVIRLKNNVGVIITTIFMIFWVMSAYFYSKNLARYSYLREQFSRQNKLALKSHLMMTSTLFFPAILFFMSKNTAFYLIGFLGLIILLGISHLRSFRWEA